jgi:hypothetical protein
MYRHERLFFCRYTDVCVTYAHWEHANSTMDSMFEYTDLVRLSRIEYTVEHMSASISNISEID